MVSFKNYLQEKQEAIHVKKGAFHAWLGKSPDEPITAADIAKGKAAGGHAEKMAIFAQNFGHHKEEVESVNELSRTTLGSYHRKSHADIEKRYANKEVSGKGTKLSRRIKGKVTAVNKIATKSALNQWEETEINEKGPMPSTNKGYDPYNSNQGGAAPKKKKNIRQIAMKMAQKKGVDPRNSHDAQAKAYKSAFALHGPKNEEVEVTEAVTGSKEQLQAALKKAEVKAAGVERSKSQKSYIEALKAAIRRIKEKKNVTRKEVGLKAEETINELSSKTKRSWAKRVTRKIEQGKGKITDKEERRFNRVSKIVSAKEETITELSANKITDYYGKANKQIKKMDKKGIKSILKNPKTTRNYAHRHMGTDLANKKMFGGAKVDATNFKFEETITELSKEKLSDYTKGAVGDLRARSHMAGYDVGAMNKTSAKDEHKREKRHGGILRAVSKLSRK